MFSTAELRFAQKYPFSETAKNIVKHSNFSLEGIPDEVVNRAKAMIVEAASNKPYDRQIKDAASILTNEILAFPTAKILLSCMNKPELYSKFSSSISKTCFKYLENEKPETLIDLANELKLKINLVENQNNDFLIEINLIDFLSINFRDNFLKLVNRKLSRGKVHLNKNEFVRFLSEIIYKRIHSSLPIETKQIPQNLKQISFSMLKELPTIEKTYAFKKLEGFGTVQPEFFPPCMASLYASLLSGENVPHMGRYSIATFLLSIGMPKEQVVSLFKFAPNWNEKITTYQVSRLAGKTGHDYAAPSCAKVKSYGYCPQEECSISHPVSYYRQQLLAAKKAEKTPPTQNKK